MNETRKPIVVIVEDDVDLAEVYAEWLVNTYQVRMAHTAEDAKTAIDNDIDVVLLDRRLPETSGDELLAWMTSQSIKARVAMITAVSPDFDVIEMGFDTYAVKPVSRTELTDIVQMLLTRTIYDQRVQRFLELLSKQEVLEQEKNAEELDENPEYSALSRELTDLRAELDYLLRNLDDDYFASEMQALVGGFQVTD